MEFGNTGRKAGATDLRPRRGRDGGSGLRQFRPPLAAFLLILFLSLARGQEPGRALVRVEAAGGPALASSGAALLTRFEDGAMLASAGPDELRRLEGAGARVEVLDERMGDMPYWIARIEAASSWEGVSPRLAPLGVFGKEIVYRGGEAEAMSLAESGFPLRKVTRHHKPTAAAPEWRAVSIAKDAALAAALENVTAEALLPLLRDLTGQTAAQVGGEPFTIKTRNSYQASSLQKAAQYCLEYFQARGLEAHYHNFTGAGKINVIATQAGKTHPDEYVVVCAHLDDMPGGPTAPGADDNGSGSVAVLGAAGLFAQRESDRSIIYALWTGEEQGLIGSSAFASEAKAAGMKIVGVVNMDMIAWDGDGVPDIEAHGDYYVPGSGALADTYRDVAAAYGLDLRVSVLYDGMRRSDHASFWDEGYPAFLLIEPIDGDFNSYYHTTLDTIAHCHMGFYVQTTRAALATTAHLAGVRCAVPGDIDLNGRADAADVALLAAFLGERTDGRPLSREACDVDGNGRVDAVDLVQLKVSIGEER